MSDSMTQDQERALSFNVPSGLHPDTADLVVRFAAALASKLHKAEKKHGYSDGWKADDWQFECSEKLVDHLEKGDPRDVAAYCAFMWHHGWCTSLQVTAYASPKRPTIRDPLLALCAAPQPAQARQALTDEELHLVKLQIGTGVHPELFNRIARAIEATHGILAAQAAKERM